MRGVERGSLEGPQQGRVGLKQGARSKAKDASFSSLSLHNEKPFPL
jgi:hypothetical protein